MFSNDLKMKHAVDVETRAICRGLITTIRNKYDLNRKDAEDIFRRTLFSCLFTEKFFEIVDDEVREREEDLTFINSCKSS